MNYRAGFDVLKKGEVGIEVLKLIALDLDGTLLRKDKTIGPATQRLLHELYRRGIAITIATGRMYHSSQHVQDLLGFPLNFICTDGAYLRPALADRPVLQTIPPSIVKAVLYTLREALDALYLVSNDRLYTRAAAPNPGIRAWGFALSCCCDCPTLEALEQVEQMIIIDRAPKARGIYKALSTALPGLPLEMSPSLRPGYYQLVIRPPGVDKGSGLSQMAKALGISISATIAFGDWLNDLPLFRVAGLAVAPANAVPEVKAQAGIVSARSNDQDFIAFELEKLLAERKIIA